jgi:serine/threonine-protein kinase
MALTLGTKLGPYEVIAPLGSGGMGEVYRARDQRLSREVAIKALPEAFTSDPERVSRFEREARLLASLSHPNIAGIHGLELAEGQRYLVLEFVEGETLAQRLERGALAAPEAADVCRQVAAAGEAAHEAGVVHRDLKPGNVMLKPDGTAKVLDFGLAKSGGSGAAPWDPNLTRSPTMTLAATGVGVILGTAAYMSPEQVQGKAVDRRTDIWSFGCVLFECLTGRRAFEGETLSDLVARILEREPDWSALPSGLSPRWRSLIERCLTKDPKRRLQAMGEARIALEDLAAHPEDAATAAGTPAPRASRLAFLPWAVAAAALVALTVSLWRPGSIPPAVTELSVVPAGGEQVGVDVSYHPLAISPDGRTIAYTVLSAGVLKLHLRRLDTREDVEIAGTDGARNLFFSPDGEWIAFFDSHKLYKVSAHGGTPVGLADALLDRLGTWLDDGTIVYSRGTTEPLYRIPEAGGAPVAITALDTTRRERTHRFPCALDGGPWVVFTVQTVDSPGDYDNASIDAVSVRTGERRRLYKGARRAVWAPGGFLVLARGADLYAVPIDPRDPRITRDPVPVLSGVSGDASSGASYFSIANDGTLAWLPGGEPDLAREVGWFDRSGHWTPTAIPRAPTISVKLSPDGTHALASVGPGGGASDLWLDDLRAGTINRLTNGMVSGGLGVWLPGGERIAYSRRSPDGGDVVVVRRVDGAGGEREIARAPNPLVVTGTASRGRDVVYCDYGKRDGSIYLAAVDSVAPPRELAHAGDGYEQSGVVSPDGQWLAYVSNKTGREEVCVRRLDGSGGSWQLSNNRGGGARWGREGRELFFVSGETLVRVAVSEHGGTLTFGQPEPLFEAPPTLMEVSFRDYDYDPVHDRFLFTRPPRGEGERREIAVSLGWARRLAGKLSASGSERR